MEPSYAQDYSLTREAYDLLSTHYDELTEHHRYEEWFDLLIPVLEKEGLSGNRVLDLGCGTGKSTMPLVARGWRATAVDLSPGMLRILEAKAGDQVQVHEADIADLPDLGEFDLVLSLGEAMNYSAAEGGFKEALDGVRRSLAPTGLALFDLNTLHSYESFFAQTEVKPAHGATTTWTGQVSDQAVPGDMAAATMEVATEDGRQVSSTHRQRHVSEPEAITAIGEVGLECVAVYGHDHSGVLEQPLDQQRHTKGIFIAKPCRQTEERR
jgi:SAM-dependent methyltransferase